MEAAGIVGTAGGMQVDYLCGGMYGSIATFIRSFNSCILSEF